MKIIVASDNKGKIKEIKHMLGDGFEVSSLSDVGFTDEIEENGKSFEENAFIKVHAISSKFPDCIVIGDDSGLCVDALGGAPGIYSARYSGMHGNDAANIEKLEEELSNKNDRNAHFTCLIAVRMPDGEEFSVAGYCYGEIAEKPQGENGFGYDPVFYIPKLGCTMAQLTEEEKNKISHRGKAVLAFTEELKRRLK